MTALEHKGELSALIASIRDGLPGVTPGPWVATDGSMDDPNSQLPPWEVHQPSAKTVAYFARGEVDAAHIARLSPNNMLRLLDELDAREAECVASMTTIAEERERAEAAEAQVKALSEALQNMMGAFDTPVTRRRIDNALAVEARIIARNALAEIRPRRKAKGAEK